MNDALATFTALPLAARIAIGALIVAQISLQVYSLFDLARRERVGGLPRWGWVLVIVLGELIGPILYLAVGRSVPAAVEDPLRGTTRPGATTDRAERAADVLYGRRGAR
jgi:hypothetical protein